MKLSKKYSKSPIIEATCQFGFKNPDKWDWTIPGILYQKINNVYPIKEEIWQKGVEFHIKSESKDSPEFIPLNKIIGMRFLNEKRNRLIQIQEKTLSINILKPYTDWKEFKSQIINALKVYNNQLKPDGILRIGLRYINNFDFLPERFEIEKYFNYYPIYPDKNQESIGEMIVRSSIPIPNIREQEGFMHLLLYLNQPIGQKDRRNILDLDMVFLRNNENLIMIDEAKDYIEKAHTHIKEIFESCITDEMRKEIE